MDTDEGNQDEVLYPAGGQGKTSDLHVINYRVVKAHWKH